MTIEERSRRQERLNQLLLDISKQVIEEDDDECIRYSNLFLEIYVDNFRHNYSLLYSTLVDINTGNENSCFDYLITNLLNISRYAEIRMPENRDLSLQLSKLSDHINLEYSRIKEQEKMLSSINTVMSQLADASLAVEDATTAVENATAAAESATNKAEKIQVDILAVLSIFSAVVLAFMGSITLLGSAMQSIKDVRVYKLVLICSFCGIVIFNTLFVLLYIVSKIINKSIYARCESDDCTCGDNSNPKCNPIQRVRKRLPYVFYFNVFMISVILFISLWEYLNFPEILQKISFFILNLIPNNSSST